MSLHETLSGGTIIACSSGEGQKTALSVIRITGFEDLNEFQSVFSKELKLIEPRRVYYVNLILEKRVLDSVCMVYFSAPASFTGENVLELTVHGNPLNVENIIKLFLTKFEMRLATPGEFSYRALKNKKLTLTQIEGLELFLNANSDFVLEKGQQALLGELDKSYLELRQKYLALKSAVELSIDFFEDVGEEQARKNLEKSFGDFKQVFYELFKRLEQSDESLLRPKIVLLGEPNAGKSTLFNRLLNYDRSIVSPQAGTTRDYVSESVSFDGVTYHIVDTAGLRETGNEIEAIGIRKSLELYQTAFFRILLINPVAHQSENLKNVDLSMVDLILYTHLDHPEFPRNLKRNFLDKNCRAISLVENGPIEPVKRTISGPIEPLSGKNTGPIEPNELKSGPIEPPFEACLEDIWKIISLKFKGLASERPILVGRQRKILREINNELCSFESLLNTSHDITIISAELNNIGQLIYELIGVTTPDEVLSNIFKNFCIGK